jgi:hypothetical protein
MRVLAWSGRAAAGRQVGGQQRACPAEPSATADDRPRALAEHLGNGGDARARRGAKVSLISVQRAKTGDALRLSTRRRLAEAIQADPAELVGQPPES